LNPCPSVIIDFLGTTNKEKQLGGRFTDAGRKIQTEEATDPDEEEAWRKY
jgi:hypothetical protein